MEPREKMEPSFEKAWTFFLDPVVECSEPEVALTVAKSMFAGPNKLV